MKNISFDTDHSWALITVSGKRVFGWFCTDLDCFYEYGTGGGIVRAEEVAGLREVSWSEATANLNIRGMPPLHMIANELRYP